MNLNFSVGRITMIIAPINVYAGYVRNLEVSFLQPKCTLRNR